MNAKKPADLIVYNGRITTLDPKYPAAGNLAIQDGRIVGVGDAESYERGPNTKVIDLNGRRVIPGLNDSHLHVIRGGLNYNIELRIVGRDDAERYERGPNTKVIDLKGRRVIPGLNDSHLHVIRGGLNFNMELRWDGVPSLADALDMLRKQVAGTPAPQGVRVVGGWNEFQFAERRGPTLEEINAIPPYTPVFILHLYDSALLNGAALRAVGYTKDTPNPPGGEIQRDKRGNPTGMLIARPNAGLLYATLAKGPKLAPDDQANSTRHFMRELNRLGVTSAIDAGGGFQNYPEDYQVIDELHRRGEMTVRVAYNLFTQHPRQELDDFT